MASCGGVGYEIRCDDRSQRLHWIASPPGIPCSPMNNCPFCRQTPASVWLESTSAFALWDRFPISEGHTLVVPRCHVASLFDLPVFELASVWEFVARVRGELAARFQVDAFNIGLNDGRVAGQTVMHAHIHVVPRRDGDMFDPRGGVRRVIPEKADYWTIKS